MPQYSSRNKALLALLLISPAPSVGVIVGLTMGEGMLGASLWAAAKVWLLGFPLFWRVVVDRAVLSLSPPRRGGFGVAAAVGVAFAVVIFAAYFLVGRHAIDPERMRRTLEPMRLTQPAVYLGAAAYWILVNSVLEEYVYRWFIFRKCEALVPGRAAAVAAGFIFVVHHTLAMAAYFNWWVTLLASVGIFVAGVAWSVLYLRYRSVWVPYLSHAIADLAIFIVGWWILFA